MGTCDKDTAFEILDYYYNAGGNFIDTSGNYQVGNISENQHS
jgi:aryl-alcohol dehydrogenase-like predicted oxidoreductase